jgi:membrane protein involved in colicin uptake
MTVEFFFRDGTPASGVRGEGTSKHAPRFHACRRCGGQGGSEAWKFTGWTCYDCGGTRGRTKLDPVYLAEKLAKLNATKAAAAEKRAAKAKAAADAAAAKFAAERDAWMATHGATVEKARAFVGRSSFLGDLLARLESKLWTEGQLAAVEKIAAQFTAEAVTKAASGYVGKIGERITATVTVERVYSFERPQFAATWLSETVNIVTMRDAAGNAIVVKSASFHAAKGDTFQVRGTVKAQEEYRGEKQTTLTRAKIIEDKSVAQSRENAA